MVKTRTKKDRKYYLKNKKRIRENSKKYYIKHRAELLVYAKNYINSHRVERNIYRKSWREKNREKLNAEAVIRIRKIRNLVLEKFGKKCASCGFNDVRALQVDHINGGGMKEIRSLTNRTAFHKKVLKDETGQYQLLCANCNWIKRHVNKEYAHGRRKKL